MYEVLFDFAPFSDNNFFHFYWFIKLNSLFIDVSTCWAFNFFFADSQSSPYSFIMWWTSFPYTTLFRVWLLSIFSTSLVRLTFLSIRLRIINWFIVRGGGGIRTLSPPVVWSFFRNAFESHSFRIATTSQQEIFWITLVPHDSHLRCTSNPTLLLILWIGFASTCFDRLSTSLPLTKQISNPPSFLSLQPSCRREISIFIRLVAWCHKFFNTKGNKSPVLCLSFVHTDTHVWWFNFTKCVKILHKFATCLTSLLAW